MHNILCFGDSITFGEYDQEGGGWVDRLKRFGFEYTIQNKRKKEFKVTNLGISGETSTEALVRLEKEIEVRLDEDLKTVLIFAYGANDDAFLVKKNDFAVSLDEFKKNIETMILIGKKNNAEVFFLPITPVIDEMHAIPNHRGKTRSNATAAKYNTVIKEVASLHGTTYINLDPHFQATNEHLGFDGLHPNSVGHEVIFKTVKNALSVLW